MSSGLDYFDIRKQSKTKWRRKKTPNATYMPNCSVSCPQSHVFSMRTGQGDLARNSQMDGEGSSQLSSFFLPHVIVLDFCLCKRSASIKVIWDGPALTDITRVWWEWGG